MKRWMIGMVAMVMIAGCSGVITRGTASALVENNSVVGQGQLASAATQPFTTLTAPEVVAANTARWTVIRQATTGNFFEWLFVPAKTIWVDSTYYTLINQTGALLDGAEQFEAAFTSSDWNKLVIFSASRLVDLQKAKDGVK